MVTATAENDFDSPAASPDQDPEYAAESASSPPLRSCPGFEEVEVALRQWRAIGNNADIKSEIEHNRSSGSGMCGWVLTA
jgi:hypothetical protein